MSYKSNQVLSCNSLFSFKITLIFKSLLFEILIFWLLLSLSQDQSLNPNEFVLLMIFHCGAVIFLSFSPSKLKPFIAETISCRNYFNIFLISLQSISSSFFALPDLSSWNILTRVSIKKRQIYVKRAHIFSPNH